MLPVSYRLVKGFATFFGVMGILACIAGLIAGIIMHGNDGKPKVSPQTSLSGSSSLAPSGERGATGTAGSEGAGASTSAVGTPSVQSSVI